MVFRDGAGGKKRSLRFDSQLHKQKTRIYLLCTVVDTQVEEG